MNIRNNEGERLQIGGDWKWVTQYSERGIRFRMLENQTDMADAIRPEYARCVFYVYPTLNDAKSGAHSGGTGVFVGIKSAIHSEQVWLYAVTNDHVLRETFGAHRYCPNPAIRMMTRDGTPDPLSTNVNRWIRDRRNDVAVLPLEVDLNQFDHTWVEYPNEFVHPEFSFWPHNAFGGFYLGDEVFMIGRLIGSDGKEINYPTVRSGILSAMPHDKATGGDFLVEMHSIAGYSGSPAFIRWNTGSHRPFGGRMGQPSAIGFLGLNHQHIYYYADVLNHKTQKAVRPKKVVQINTGVSAIVPASKIGDILQSEELTMKRTNTDNELTERKKNETYRQNDAARNEPVMQTTAQGIEIPIPATDQFFADLEKASRKKE